MSKKYQPRDETKRSHFITVRLSDDEMESLDCFTRMHQEMCHRYVEASKSGDPESARILEDVKAFERMMDTYMNAEMMNYKFIDRRFYDFIGRVGKW